MSANSMTICSNAGKEGRHNATAYFTRFAHVLYLGSRQMFPITFPPGGSESLRQSVARSWLEHYSAYGFLKVPPLLDVIPVDESGILRKKPVFRILTTQTGPGAICVASAGHSCILAPCQNIHAVIDRLNQGTPVPLKELYESYGKQAAIIQAIDFCLRSGAVVLAHIQP